eukprot:CAMPEP_0180245150 /NCGR_PEP_ID=MMETSP0987-20121128/34833_1 /TAXON_ID=697907 /ORGANISM="non described non described, Strain CCMP2293" /LENGTH=74 /DNA_ID=CAMNT_0022212771 /DNA_START=12 /DNA_END=233 /DNA_ORIENTATION=+
MAAGGGAATAVGFEPALAPSEGALSQSRLESLNRLGFVWSKQEIDWDEMFEEMMRYKIRFGHCNVPYKGSSLQR